MTLRFSERPLRVEKLWKCKVLWTVLPLHVLILPQVLTSIPRTDLLRHHPFAPNTACPILAVRFWLSHPAILFWKSVLAALSGQSWSGNPGPAVLSWQSYPACPLLPVNFCLTRSVCPVMAILFLLPAVVTNRNFRKKVIVRKSAFFNPYYCITPRCIKKYWKFMLISRD
jgi:ABC-type sugar transport system permease subunit